MNSTHSINTRSPVASPTRPSSTFPPRCQRRAPVPAPRQGRSPPVAAHRPARSRSSDTHRHTPTGDILKGDILKGDILKGDILKGVPYDLAS